MMQSGDSQSFTKALEWFAQPEEGWVPSLVGAKDNPGTFISVLFCRVFSWLQPPVLRLFFEHGTVSSCLEQIAISRSGAVGTYTR